MYVLTIAPAPRPEGQAAHYHFFTHLPTGRKWKVRVRVVAIARGAAGAAPTDHAITVTAAPVGDTGHALRDGGLPMVGDPWTHRVSALEAAAPDFDIDLRIHGLIAERIADGERMILAIEARRAAALKWNGDG